MSEEWKPYVVQQGDHLDKLAFRRGVEPDEIWAHEKNSQLANQRTNRDTLCPGDLLHLPAEPAEGLEVIPSATNRYTATIPTVPVSVLVAIDGEPIGNEPYEVRGIYPGERVLTGTTTPDGYVELAVPVHIREIEIEITEHGMCIPVDIGDLDPIEERSGVVQRLRNLDYLSDEGEIDDEELVVGVRQFQAAEAMDPTGQVDAQTRAAILERHGV